MTIVSDTTPLRYLVEIEAAHVLEKLFGKVIIPEKVSEELQGQRTPQRVKDWIQSPPDWLEVRRADTSLFVPKRKIQEGERQAIALAIELQAGALLCDDFRAIEEAHRVNIPTIRLFNILERAAEDGLLDLPKAVDKISRTTFHLPPDDLVDAMLERDRKREEKDKPVT